MKLELKPHPVLADTRVLAVLSPGSLARLPWFKQHLGTVFPRLDAIAPGSLEQLQQAVGRSAGSHEVVLAVGGDGTLHQVLNAADTTRQILGVVRSGTGNDFARTIGLPKALPQAVAMLQGFTPQPTDYGVVNGIRFHNSAGFGVDSATLYLRQTRKNLLTRNYNIAFIMALAALQCPPIELEIDGEQLAGRYYWALAMNSHFIGGGTRIAPRSELGDGLLDMVLVRETGKLNMLRHMPAAIQGRHLGLPLIHYQQARRMTCRLEQAQDYLQIDGELTFCGERTISFEVRPGGMRFLR